MARDRPLASADVPLWEVDWAELVPLDQARALLHPDQQVFIDQLLVRLGERA